MSKEDKTKSTSQKAKDNEELSDRVIDHDKEFDYVEPASYFNEDMLKAAGKFEREHKEV